MQMCIRDSYIDNYAFSFDRQKFISDFYQEYNDMKSFEAAILELVLEMCIRDS